MGSFDHPSARTFTALLLAGHRSQSADVADVVVRGNALVDDGAVVPLVEAEVLQPSVGRRAALENDGPGRGAEELAFVTIGAVSGLRNWEGPGCRAEAAVL